MVELCGVVMWILPLFERDAVYRWFRDVGRAYRRILRRSEVKAIAAQGESMQSDYPEIARQIAKKYMEVIASGVDEQVAREVLMRAEAQLCAMEAQRARIFVDLVRGCGTKAIAEREGVTVRTIQRHLSDAINKMRHETILDVSP